MEKSNNFIQNYNYDEILVKNLLNFTLQQSVFYTVSCATPCQLLGHKLL